VLAVRSRCATVRLRGERGAVTVLVAILIPVLLLLASFVIDVGNWFQHERHLQLQADAGALAGGQFFNALSCDSAAIKNRAMQYSGMTGGSTPVFNQLTGNTTTVSENINTQAYTTQPNQPTPDPTAMTGNPCSDELLDLKLTETPLPWYFQAAGVGGINAHARVSLLQQTTGTGFLPIGVNETSPVAARAYFINEATGNVITSVPLVNAGKNAQGDDVWSNSAAPQSVTINTANVGVIIALSGDPNNTTCPSNSKLVNCYDLNPGPSLEHVQGWSASGTGTPMVPIARSVTLQAGTGITPCADGYFSNATADCTFGVSAKVDVGAIPPTSDIKVNAVVGGTSYPLSYQTATDLWTGSATLTAATGSGQIDLTVKCTKGASDPACTSTKTSTLSDVQRAYAASSTTSGTIDNVVVSEGGVGDANSFQQGTTHNLVVTAAVAGSLQDAQSVGDPLYVMRFPTGNTTSQTGAIACPPGGQGGLKQDLASGCSGTYQCNGSTALGCISDSPCANTNPSPGPADCVNADTGLATGQLRQGMATRMANAPCPNNWSSYPNIPTNDPRIVQVFVTSYGSFGGNGQASYPIQSFASFYIMGWDGDPCNSDTFPPGENAGSAKDQIWGHFIQYVDFKNTGGGGSQTCNLNSFGDCVVVLTR
jgi:hypothetical protein